VLTISAPTDYRDLGAQLIAKWPSLAAYVVSFFVVGVMWLNHHSVFASFARVDRPLYYLNLAVLLTVVLVPYPTGILGTALSQPGHEGATAAAVAYSGLMAVQSYCWGGLWLYASTGRRLLVDSFPEARRRPATLAFTSGIVIYTLTIGVALVSAGACLVVHALVALYYAIDPLSRRAQPSE
jgi:uncharacterized membrane protein